MHFLYFLIIGLVAGWLAGLIMKGSGFGLVGDLVIGVLGAFFGGWLIHDVMHVDFGLGPLLSALLTATLGAVALLFIIKVIRKV